MPAEKKTECLKNYSSGETSYGISSFHCSIILPLDTKVILCNFPGKPINVIFFQNDEKFTQKTVTISSYNYIPFNLKKEAENLSKEWLFVKEPFLSFSKVKILLTSSKKRSK